MRWSRQVGGSGGTTPERRTVRWAVATGVIVFITAGFGLSPVGAGTLDLPIDTVVRSDPGTVTELRTVTVDPTLVGSTCELGITAENQESVHPGNNLVVTSGDSQATLSDVEGEAGRVSNAVAPEIVLGDTVVVSLVMGPDGVFSGGFSVTLSCDDGEAATDDTSPTTAPTTTAPTTTTGEVDQLGSTTTTSQAPDTTTTTEPPTTTTEPPTTTTTTEGDVESASETNDGVLARTGVDSTAVLTLIASALILAGVALFSTANLIARRS